MNIIINNITSIRCIEHNGMALVGVMMALISFTEGTT